MTVVSTNSFAILADRDPIVAPLARLYEIAHASASDLAWDEAVPRLDRTQAEMGIPLLHKTVLRPEEAALRRLAETLTARAGIAPDATSSCALVQAAVRDELVVAPALAVVAQLLALPLLQAAGRRAAPLLTDLTWDAGWCPTCGAIPLLAESRGLDRERWLRCGRCATGWRFDPVRCAFCGTRDHKQLGYLAAERQAEARRALTCEECGGYLKAVATIAASSPAELALADLATVELDVAAAERGFSRPPGLGFPLDIVVEPRRRSPFSLLRR